MHFSPARALQLPQQGKERWGDSTDGQWTIKQLLAPSKGLGMEASKGIDAKRKTKKTYSFAAMRRSYSLKFIDIQ